MPASVTEEPRSGSDVEPESKCANNVENLTFKNIQNKERDEDNMNQEINILKELKTCQEHFQMLKEKIALDEIWKSIINEFILAKFGYDVQKVLSAYSVGLQSSFDWNPSSNSGAASPSPPEKEVQENPSVDRFNVSLDSNFLSSRRKGKQLSEFKNTDGKYDLPTPSALAQSYSDAGAGALPRSPKIPRYSPSLIYSNKSTPTLSNWTCIPTFPLYDAANAVSDINSTIASGNVLIKKELQQKDYPNYQDPDYDEGYENRSEVTFNEVENQIRQVVPPGTRSKVYECIICNKSLTQKQNARLHVRRVHFGERLKCIGCGRSFYDRRSIANHKATCTKYNEWSKSAGSNLLLNMPEIEIRTRQSESDTSNRRYYLHGDSAAVSRGSHSNSNSNNSAELLVGTPLKTETETGMISNNAFSIGLDSDINYSSQNESNSPSAVEAAGEISKKFIVHDKYITHGLVSGSSKRKKGSQSSSKHPHHHENEIPVPLNCVITHENQHEGRRPEATPLVYFENRSPSHTAAEVQYEYTEKDYDKEEEDHSDSDVFFSPSKILKVEMTPGLYPLNENEETKKQTSNTEFL